MAVLCACVAHGLASLDQCQATADSWCNNSPASGDGKASCADLNAGQGCSNRYVARLGRGSSVKEQLSLQWRCYAVNVARNATNTNFASKCYCTHQDTLRDMLTRCQEEAAPASLVFSSLHPPAAPEGTPPYTMVRIPALLSTTMGTLLAFATARRGDGGDYAWNDLILRRSMDEGVTWGPVQMIPGKAFQ